MNGSEPGQKGPPQFGFATPRALLGKPRETSAPGALPSIPDHELLRRIGRGSYGEVWLARNVMGAYRAVKVIYRSDFEHDRPFEREFEGIRKFEPISRAHPSQLNILHVGRNDAEGYFYYVMELADPVISNQCSVISNQCSVISNQCSVIGKRGLNTGSLITDSLMTDYSPRTLRHDLDHCRRLPLGDGLQLGLSLTTALEHLHSHGLVHRDVKPSNIIFIHGVPKLADLGLVASMDATVSFVGTAG